MNKKELIEKLEQFRYELIQMATYGSNDITKYKELRSELLENRCIQDNLPQFVRKYENPYEFRKYMQNKSQHYKERRQFINKEMENVITYVDKQEESDLLNNVEVVQKVKHLGQGGFGSVDLYHHKILDIDFAIKFFDPLFASRKEQKDGEKRFFREAKILFELHSDNIVQVYDAGYLDGKPFIRMEYIDGYDMNELLETYSIVSFDDSLAVIIEILTGLEYAHKKGIIHRDLKPSNVMFSKKDKIFKIIDFGISTFMDVTGHTKITKTGERVAGGSYIDPQLQVNPKLRDVRSDIYSVGAIWYFLLTGQVPTGSSMKNNLMSIAQINKEKAAIVLKCLEYDLDDRYENCGELKNILLNLRTEG